MKKFIAKETLVRTAVFTALWLAFWYLGGLYLFKRIHPVDASYWFICGWQYVFVLPLYVLLDVNFLLENLTRLKRNILFCIFLLFFFLAYQYFGLLVLKFFQVFLVY